MTDHFARLKQAADEAAEWNATFSRCRTLADHTQNTLYPAFDDKTLIQAGVVQFVARMYAYHDALHGDLKGEVAKEAMHQHMEAAFNLWSDYYNKAKDKSI